MKMFNFPKKILDTIVNVPITSLPTIRAALESGNPGSLEGSTELQLFSDGFDRYINLPSPSLDFHFSSKH